MFPKDLFFFFAILWGDKKNFFLSCFVTWRGVFLTGWDIVLKEKVGFVYSGPTLTWTTRGSLLSTLWMLFLTHGESAWWPRNMREPQGSGCEQLSLLWFSFFIIFDIFEAELLKKYSFRRTYCGYISMKCRAIIKQAWQETFPFVIRNGVRTGSFIFYIRQMK